MSAYATVAAVAARMGRVLTPDEEALCGTLLEDAAVIIDATGTTATDDVKGLVSCRMVIRQMGTSADAGVPVGATQGTMSALGYSQSWTIGASGANGELYLSRLDKKLLGLSNAVGSHSPVEDIAASATEWWG